MAVLGAAVGDGGGGRRALRSPRWWREGLPPLTARALAVYTLIWALLLPLALLAPLTGVWWFAQDAGGRPAWSNFGVLVEHHGKDDDGRARDHLHVVAVPAPDVRRAGVRASDEVVALDGWRVPPGEAGARAAAERLRGRSDGDRVRVTLRGEKGVERTVTLTSSAAHAERGKAERDARIGMGLGSLSWLAGVGTAIPVLALVAAAALLFRRRRDPVAALLSLTFLMLTAVTPGAERFWREFGVTDVTGYAVTLAFLGLLLALPLFPDGRFEPRWARWGVLLFALGQLEIPVELALGQISDWWFTPVSILGLMLCVAAPVVRYRRTPPGPEKQQMRWVLLGFSAGIAFLLVMAALVLWFGRTSEVAPGTRGVLLVGLVTLFVLAMICFTGGVIVSMLRYRLYDADALISRSAALAVLTLLLGAVFAAGAKGVETLAEAQFGRDAGALPGTIAAGLAVLLITPLNHRVQGWAERRFRRALTRLRRDLPDCADDLRETATLPELLDEVLARAADGARSDRAAALVDGRPAAMRGLTPDEVAAWAAHRRLDPAAPLHYDAHDRVFPLRVPLRVRHGEGGAPLGWLLLGPRPDGSPQGRDELDALADVSDPIARAVSIVQRREARERDGRAALNALAARVAELESLVRPPRAAAE